MVVVCGDVTKQTGVVVECVDDNIQFAVIEQVSDGHSAAGVESGECGAFDSGLKIEFLSVNVAEEERALCPGGSPGCVVDLRVDVPIGDDKILPSIVVEVQKCGAPSEERNCGFRDPHLVTDIGEVAVSVVAIERVVVV